MSYQFLHRPGLPSLRTRMYCPAGPDSPRAAVLVTTGFSEHIGRYEHVCERWQSAGFIVGCWELQGQGQSSGRPGFVKHFSHFTDDLFAVLAHFTQSDAWRAAGKPFAFWHSLGGLITLTANLARKDAFGALALSSPYLGLALKPPAWQLYAGRALAKLWPTFSQPTGITAAQLTHDPVRADAIDRDPLRIRRMTAGMFTQVEAAQAAVLAHAKELTAPLYCRASGQDSIVDLAATRLLFESYGGRDKTLHVAAADFHELFQELTWQEHADAFAEQFSRWANAGIDRSPGASAVES